MCTQHAPSESSGGSASAARVASVIKGAARATGGKSSKAVRLKNSVTAYNFFAAEMRRAGAHLAGTEHTKVCKNIHVQYNYYVYFSET